MFYALFYVKCDIIGSVEIIIKYFNTFYNLNVAITNIM